MRKIQNNQAGFTLIELVVVIVILGILAATAIPKFVDLSDQAGNAAASGVAGAIASASATNYAAQLAGKTVPALNVANVCANTVLDDLISGVALISTAPTDANSYQVSGTGNCTAAGAGPGGAVECDITGYKGAAKATVICTK